MKKILVMMLSILLVLQIAIPAFASGGTSTADATSTVFGTVYDDTITETQPEDYYRFVLTEPGRIKIDITSFMRYYCIFLYNDAGVELWQKQENEWVSTTGKRTDSYSLDLETGTYYLKFNGYRKNDWDASTGNYNFMLSFTSGKANLAEPNNEIAQAQEVSFGTQYNGVIALNDREDYCKFVLSEPGRLKIDITSFMRYYCIFLYNDAGIELWQTQENEWVSTTGKRTEAYNLDLEAGTYFLKINGYRKHDWDASTGNYSLTLSFTSGNANVAEPNNAIAEAKNAEFGTQYRGVIAINDREDYFAVELPESGRLKIDVTSLMRYYCCVLYNDAGVELWQANEKEWVSTTGKRTDTYQLDLEAGTYYLKFNGYRKNDWDASTGNYNFKLSFTSAKANISEPNNDIASAKSISLNTPYNGQIAINDREDYYQISLKNDTKIKINITSYMRYYCVVVYDSFGKDVWVTDSNEWNSTTGKRSDVHEIALSAGTYYLKINGYRRYDWDASTGNYTFSVSTNQTISKPGNLKATAIKTTAAKLSWSAVDGATGYVVYRYDTATKKYKKVGTTASTSCTIKKLKPGTEYRFAVKAYQKTADKNIYSGYSSTLTIVTKIAAPKIKVSAGKQKATIKWNEVDGATGYIVYRAAGTNGKYKKIGTTANTSFKAKKLSSGQVYSFKVVAYAKVGGVTVKGTSRPVTATIK